MVGQMTETATAYPLCWPEHIPRARGRENGQFKTTLAGAIDNVQESLRLFARDSGKPLTGLVISSNVTLGASRPEDPGVAVWFSWDGIQVCIPVDRYMTVQANLQAIHHVLEARRTEMRHGTLALVRASFQGFRALPNPHAKPWRAILGDHRTRAQVEDAYRAKAKEAHPDRGGTSGAMAELNRAREQALREIVA
jgi:hypothetical protein